MVHMVLSENDRRELARRQIPQAEVQRQIALLTNPPPRLHLLRPCTPGDGIRELAEDEIESALSAFDTLRRQRRLIKFTPASGAASRMFKALVSFRNRSANSDALAAASSEPEVQAFLDNLPRYAFYADLLAASGVKPEAARDSAMALLDALLSPAGLNYPELPKGLLKFHSYKSFTRTAFEEHLVEAAAYAVDEHNCARLHFTVSPNHLPRFRELLDSVRTAYAQTLGVSFDVGFSVQAESTDTVALDLQNQLVRTSSGDIVLRPGGHGALIGNLDALDADIAFIKNIDNIVPDHLKGPTIKWKKVLGGLLARLQTRTFGYLAQLQSATVAATLIAEVIGFAKDELGIAIPAVTWNRNDPDAVRRYLITKLNRPLRVCGMVRNAGEPGGGPFWVAGTDGSASRQIVESAEVDTSNAEQRAVFEAATHFNPVDLVCGLRNWRGKAFDLQRYVNRDAVFVTEKSVNGEAVKALEHPGLWNGAMADWSTVFVEVPTSTFNPVKTVNDLPLSEALASGAA